MAPLFLWSLHDALGTEKQAKPPQESRERGHLCQAKARTLVGRGWGQVTYTSTTAGRTSGLLAAGKAGLAPRGQRVWAKPDLASHLGSAGEVRRPHASLQSLFTWKRLARTERQWERLRGQRVPALRGSPGPSPGNKR